MRHRGTRYGGSCWQCRSRKIKCTVERPACRRCLRLGLTCGYQHRFTWIQALKAGCQTYQRQWRGSESGDCTGAVEEWMFLNTTLNDLTQSLYYRDDLASAPSDEITRSTLVSTSDTTSLQSLSPSSSATLFQWTDWTGYPISILTSTPVTTRNMTDPLVSTLSSSERHLVDYFSKVVGPQCYLRTEANPYVRLILPIALASNPSPLLQAILSVSANQLRLLYGQGCTKQAWEYRGKTLKLLRTEINQLRTNHSQADSNFENCLGTILMLCCLEVSQATQSPSEREKGT